MKTPRKPRDLEYYNGQDCIVTERWGNDHVYVSATMVSGKAIVKLIYWLIRYRLWQCRDTK